MAAAQPDTPWHAAFPPPTTTAPTLAPDNLLRMYQTLGDVLDAGMLLVDVRRGDHAAGAGVIRGSLNLPAHSFPLHMPALLRLCRGDGVSVMSRLVFYSSGLPAADDDGAAERCAAWFQEYVAARAARDGAPEEPRCFVLAGGLAGWVNGGRAYLPYVEGYSPRYWAQYAPVPGVEANKRAVEHEGGAGGGGGGGVGTQMWGSSSKRTRDED